MWTPAINKLNENISWAADRSVNRLVKINSSIKDCLQSMSEGGREGGGCYVNLSLVMSGKREEEEGQLKGMTKCISKKWSTVCKLCARARSALCVQRQMVAQWRLFDSAFTCQWLSVTLCSSRRTIKVPKVSHQQVNTIRNRHTAFCKAWKWDQENTRGEESRWERKLQNYIGETNEGK